MLEACESSKNERTTSRSIKDPNIWSWKIYWISSRYYFLFCLIYHFACTYLKFCFLWRTLKSSLMYTFIAYHAIYLWYLFLRIKKSLTFSLYFRHYNLIVCEISHFKIYALIFSCYRTIVIKLITIDNNNYCYKDKIADWKFVLMYCLFFSFLFFSFFFFIIYYAKCFLLCTTCF